MIFTTIENKRVQQMCKQKSFRSKRKSNKRGGYSLLVLLFLKSKSTGTKAS